MTAGVFQTDREAWISAAGTSRLTISAELVMEMCGLYFQVFILCAPFKKVSIATADNPNRRTCRPMIRGHFRSCGEHVNKCFVIYNESKQKHTIHSTYFY